MLFSKLCWKKQSGLALIIALIFLQVIAILGIYAVECVIQAEKMSRLENEQSRYFAVAEQALRLAEEQLMKAVPACVMPIMPQSDLLAEPISWWQLSSHCTGHLQSLQYYYVVENLGPDACAEVVRSTRGNADMHNPIYFRMTLLVLDNKNQSREIVQSTVLTLNNTLSVVCQGERHQVVLGRQAWRELR